MDWSARNKRLADLGFASYDDYLASVRWRVLKANALDRAERRCQLCNRGKRLHVHHRSYHRLGSEDERRDLIVLCEQCHGRFHGIVDLETEPPIQAVIQPKGARSLRGEWEREQARQHAQQAAARAQRVEEEKRRQAKALERKRLAKRRDWRDERRLLKPNLVYREDVLNND